MTANTRQALTREANNVNARITTSKHHENKARNNGEGRKLFDAIINTAELEAHAETLLEALTAHQNDELFTLASMITIHGLKVAARGRQVKDENGKPTEKTNKKTGEKYQYTPANLTALKVLQNGINGTDGILEDLQQQTALHIWEAISQGKATITQDENNRPRLTMTNENDTDTAKAIYNTVQNYLYQHQQKHYKRQYIPVIDENGNESTELVTKAMRQYAMGLQSVDKNELIQELTAILNEVETAVLWAVYDTKEVERVTTTKRTSGEDGKTHESKKTIVSRKKTLPELSAETGYTVQTVRTTLKNIKRKLSAVLEDSGQVRRNKITSGKSSINFALSAM